MYRLINSRGEDQCGLMTDLALAKKTCDEMNRVSRKRVAVYADDGNQAKNSTGQPLFREEVTDEFFVTQYPVVHASAERMAQLHPVPAPVPVAPTA